MKEADKKYKITIIDDDEFLTDMYSIKFKGEDVFDVEVFKNGDLFLEALKGNYETDIVLLDIVLPVTDGIEVLKQIRGQNLLKDVAIVMLTNQNDEKNINEAKNLGIEGYIVKAAATPSEVVGEVKKILGI